MSVAKSSSNCFDNILALRGGCENPISTSGLYSDDIDITKDFINEIITRQFSGAQDFFLKKLAFAIKTVTDQVITFMQPNFRISSLLDNYRVGYRQDNMKVIAGDGSLKGINFDLCNSDSYLNIFISEVSLQVNYTGNVDVFVYDLMQDELIDTFTVPCTSNIVSKVFPQKVYKASREKLNLLFCYDSTGLDSILSYVRKGYCDGCSGQKGLNNPYETVNAVKIPSASQKISSNLTQLSETGGLSIVHSIQCNHVSWLCSYANMLGLSFLYKYGELVMEFAMNVSDNDRTNTTVTLNREEMAARLEIYKARYTESLNNIINGMKTPSDRKCFSCREPVRHAFAM